MQIIMLDQNRSRAQTESNTLRRAMSKMKKRQGKYQISIRMIRIVLNRSESILRQSSQH